MASRRRSEEHTSELQSRGHLVCRLLLEKKRKSRRSPSAPAWCRALPAPNAVRDRQEGRAGPQIEARVGPPPEVPTTVLLFFFLMKRAPPNFTLFPHNNPFPF